MAWLQMAIYPANHGTPITMTDPNCDRHIINACHHTVADEIVPHMVKAYVLVRLENPHHFANLDPRLLEGFGWVKWV